MSQSLTNGQNLLCSQFRLWMVIALSTATLCFCIIVVLTSCAQPEMSRINAQSVITSRTIVADAHPLWNSSAIGQFPREDMRTDPSATDFKMSIAILTRFEVPHPASICFGDMIPEVSNGISDSKTDCVTLHSAIGAILVYLGCSVENPTTGETFELHLKPFFSGVKGANDSRRWLSLQYST